MILKKLLKAIMPSREKTSHQSQQMNQPEKQQDQKTQARDNLPAGKHGRKEPIKVGENQFVDDGSEATGKEFETPDIAPTPRRKPVKMVEVVCNTCGKKEEINPAYKAGTYHRCSRCVG